MLDVCFSFIGRYLLFFYRKHQELLNQIKETESHSVFENAECELEHLVKKMEIKVEQISKLKKHQDNVRRL